MRRVIPAGQALSKAGLRQPTTAEVRLDEGRATSSGAMRPSESLFWLPTGWLRPNFVAVASMRRKIAPNRPGIRGISVKPAYAHHRAAAHRSMPAALCFDG